VTVCKVVCAEQPHGMMMSPMMRGVNAGGYYPGPYEVSNHCVADSDYNNNNNGLFGIAAKA